MDSMRTLNTSLPTSASSRSNRPSDGLIQSFRTAALSVTNLYKNAASDRDQTRQEGYQDALDDLLVFLDKQNLGLGDGEGWKVREWATARLAGTSPPLLGSESDDEQGDNEKRARSSSPVVTRKSSRDRLPAARSESPVRREVAASSLVAATQEANSLPTSNTFTFRSAKPYPQDVEMQVSDTSSSDVSKPELQPLPQPSPSAPAIRLEVVPKGIRTPHRHGNQSTRHSTRSTTSIRTLGPGAGSKRRLGFHPFFDMGSLGDSKDGSAAGGGKRGRLS